METHSLAELFPPMDGEQFQALLDSIREHGLREPLTTYEGKILDGRNRYLACQQLGIKPPTVEFNNGDPLSFVLDKNLKRRHLTVEQRSMVAARIANLPHGTNRYSKNLDGATAPSTTEAAVAMNVSLDSVKRAKKILTKGAPDVVKAVEQGSMSLSEGAQVADLPARDQAEIALEQDSAKRKEMIRESKAVAKAAAVAGQEVKDDFQLVQVTAHRSSEKAFYSIKEWESLSPFERRDIIEAGFDGKGSGMNEQTNESIEWARYSHNTVTGCLHDCPYCYARDIAEKMYPQKFAPTFHPGRLAGPSRVKVPAEKAALDESYRNIFANSMSDLFGQWVPEEWISATIEMARRNPQWNFLTLTKFPQRAANFDFPGNWWMGTSVDAQARVDNAEKAFKKINCKTKWLSVEPLLEPLTFRHLELFQWVVIGGASRSEKTPEWVPPFEWVARLHLAAKDAGCRVYHKTNLKLSDDIRVREFPWINAKEKVLPKSFRYLKDM